MRGSAPACRCSPASGAAPPGPEHGDGQGERHGGGQGYVEVLAHATRLTALGTERKQMLSQGIFAAKQKEASNQGVGGSDKGQGVSRLLKVEFSQSTMYIL